MSRLVWSCLVLALSAATALAAEPALTRYEYTEPHMGTKFQLIMYAVDEKTARDACKAAFARVAELDGIMSDYKPTSELMQLCDKAGGDPVKVSEELFTVLTKAQEVSKVSDGAFDVTVGPVVRLWRLARRTKRLPDADDLKTALELVGYKNVKLDAKERTAQLLKAGMRLDLGGIAKGYAADEAIAVLKKHAIDRALVAAGGDIAVSGPPPDKDGWTIEIQPLAPEEVKSPRHLILKNAGVSTSGDAEQYVEIDGQRYSHIVDPRTGVGLLGHRSVTVVAPNGITSDSMTKVASVLGEEGLKIIEKQEGVTARIVRLTDKGAAEITATKNFPKLYEAK
jgi:thiamine biosynthesis lipoprotein